MTKAIVIGAASGMGMQASRLLIKKGYKLSLADKQFALLKTFAQELSPDVLTCEMDVACHTEARQQLLQMIHAVGGGRCFYLLCRH